MVAGLNKQLMPTYGCKLLREGVTRQQASMPVLIVGVCKISLKKPQAGLPFDCAYHPYLVVAIQGRQFVGLAGCAAAHDILVGIYDLPDPV